MEKLITIFTPTYNRAHTLPQLFESLQQQELKNFQWVIVDDGSKDETEELVQSWQSVADFPLIYQKKPNEGKHIAINQGVDLADTALFFIVDSDDYLTADATLKIADYYPKIKDAKDLAGMSFRRGTDSKTYIGSPSFSDEILSVFEFRYRRNIKGDMAEVYKTEVMREFPFPKLEGEKFCPESMVWNRMGLKYKLLWTSHIIYICHYLEGGLTDRMFEIRRKSPETSIQYYSELGKMPIPFKDKLKANINFWRFARYSNQAFFAKLKLTSVFLSLIGLPLSVIFLFKDKS